MSSQAMYQRFVEKAPVTVMVRSTLEYVLAPQAIDAIFARSAIRQHQGELLFSSVVELLATVVWRQRDSVGQAYQQAKDQFTVSVRSVYNKLNGVETQVCGALVRDVAESLIQVVDALGTLRKPQLEGYQTRIIDGNHLAASEHRLKVLRYTKSGPLPGQSLAVLDPDRMLIVDLFPCEDGHAQERSLLPEVIASVRPDQLWIGDRNFGTSGFLFGIAKKKACFLIRQHKSTLSWEKETKPQKIGRCETGVLYEQILHLIEGDQTLPVRRITIQLKKSTRSGETEINLLTNLPAEHANAHKVAELYLQRWTIENAFQEIEQAFRSEINTLAYPGAALLGFSIAVLTYNVLSVVKWAIEKEHRHKIQREQLSGYYLAGVIAADYWGMMIALPEEEWTARFANLTCPAFAEHLRTCACHVRIDAFRKNVRGPKRPRPKRSSGQIQHHVSTARLLAEQKMTASQG